MKRCVTDGLVVEQDVQQRSARDGVEQWLTQVVDATQYEGRH